MQPDPLLQISKDEPDSPTLEMPVGFFNIKESVLLN